MLHTHTHTCTHTHNHSPTHTHTREGWLETGHTGDPYPEESRVVDDLHGDTGMLVVCVSSVFALLTQTQTHIMEDTNKKFCSSTSSTKREIY